MQHEENRPTESDMALANVNRQASVVWRSIVMVISVSVVAFLALYNLMDYPVTWFDEGFTLQVPKTLVRFGEYAIYTNGGFYYHGISNGPTVILPIAAAFWLFGIGLLQARVVMVLYLLAAIYTFYRLARALGERRLAWVATALLVVSPAALIRLGRQGLGEVPGLFFLVAGLAMWFAAWERAGWRRLGLVGLLLGLAMVTKHLYLLILVPTLGLGWLANLMYYRTTPQRVFIVPGLVAVACFALWQVCMISFWDPATFGEGLTLLGGHSARVALAFSPDLMRQNTRWLLGGNMHLGWMLPALLYGLILALPRQREGQQWGVLLVLVAVNLIWFSVASIGWPRYAFPGLAIASLFITRFFYDLTGGFQLDATALWEALRQNQPVLRKHALRWMVLIWLAVIPIALPLKDTVQKLVSPAFNAPVAMAAYLDGARAARGAG
jgi:4-amino-4-deoxy-L-arabinose transferase-like glycosyltransferase